MGVYKRPTSTETILEGEYESDNYSYHRDYSED